MQYAIILTAELDALSDINKFFLLSKIGETGLDTIRKSIDGTKGVIKWDGTENPCESLGLTNILYSHDGILAIMATADWNKQRGE